MLWIYSLAHFCVDFSCAYFIYSRFLNPWQWTLCLVLYNFCAFAMQAPLGLLGDKINRNAVYAAAGCVIVALSAFLAKYAMPACIAAGLGNALFHLGGGIDTLNESGEKCGKLYSLTNAFLEKEEAFLVKMEKVVSSFVRAKCEFIAGVSSGSSGNSDNSSSSSGESTTPVNPNAEVEVDTSKPYPHANEDGTANAMVAAWGSISDMNQVAIYVAKSHKTVSNIKARKAFTVSMANEENIKAVDYLGITSGNKVADKFAKSGLAAVKSAHVDAPLVAELPLALECKFVSYDDESELLLGEIVNVTADESVLEGDKLSVEKLAPVCYDPAGHGYYVMERRVGNAFSDGKELK